ncbi:Agmatine deiminase (EC [Streptomyces globisporus]|uniref:Agmatine deiminase (EC) n=1 Tax=Streptomyces globisporus TaxID=1908 RepID=A0ABN8V158_STRGL|nr:Agmatine deiminase (EC [Streptomyces globisporus]
MDAAAARAETADVQLLDRTVGVEAGQRGLRRRVRAGVTEVGVRLSRLLRVAIRVPAPSCSMAPPSPTKSAEVNGTPTYEAIRSATRVSWRWVCLLPQPTKLRPTASRPPARLVRNTGPASRIQQSSTGMELMTVTDVPHSERALAALAELPDMTTGSYRAMVRAVSAMSASMPARLPGPRSRCCRAGPSTYGGGGRPRRGRGRRRLRTGAGVAPEFPDRDVVPVVIDTVTSGGGGIHCATHDQPGEPVD